MKITYIVIAPPVSGTAIMTFDHGGDEEWQRKMGAEIGLFEPDGRTAMPNGPKHAVEIVYDAKARTVSFGDQIFPESPDVVYVISIDQQWQARLTLEDDNLALPAVEADIRDELRRVHQSVTGGLDDR